jgi:hypothetical protein
VGGDKLLAKVTNCNLEEFSTEKQCSPGAICPLHEGNNLWQQFWGAPNPKNHQHGEKTQNQGTILPAWG